MAFLVGNGVCAIGHALRDIGIIRKGGLRWLQHRGRRASVKMGMQIRSGSRMRIPKRIHTGDHASSSTLGARGVALPPCCRFTVALFLHALHDFDALPLVPDPEHLLNEWLSAVASEMALGLWTGSVFVSRDALALGEAGIQLAYLVKHATERHGVWS